MIIKKKIVVEFAWTIFKLKITFYLILANAKEAVEQFISFVIKLGIRKK
jgi:hypothetical protein